MIKFLIFIPINPYLEFGFTILSLICAGCVNWKGTLYCTGIKLTDGSTEGWNVVLMASYLIYIHLQEWEHLHALWKYWRIRSPLQCCHQSRRLVPDESRSTFKPPTLELPHALLPDGRVSTHAWLYVHTQLTCFRASSGIDWDGGKQYWQFGRAIFYKGENQQSTCSGAG